VVRLDRRFEVLIYCDEWMNSGSDFARTRILFRTMHYVPSVVSAVHGIAKVLLNLGAMFRNCNISISCSADRHLAFTVSSYCWKELGFGVGDGGLREILIFQGDDGSMHEGFQTLIQTLYQLQIGFHSLDSFIQSINSFGFKFCYAIYVTIFYTYLLRPRNAS